ncbi:MAG: hypothetical protein QOK05_1759 [Chloroflexota bacterium]|nr:hypothetical protein [Chloroflexota bacterium]
MSPEQANPAATVADILALPLEEFTPARDRLAKELRKVGDRDAAAEVAALRKPGVHLWAVNQLAREREMAVKRLLATAADLAAAQQEVLAGSAGAGDRLRRDSGEYQRSLDQAVRETRDLLRAATRGAGEETLRRVREVLANGALGPAGQRERLAAGMLTEEPEALGFGAFAAEPSATPRAPDATRPGARARTPSREPGSSAPAAAARAGERERERARRAEEAAAAEAERTRKAELRRDLDHAEAELRRAEQTAHRLRRRAEATAAEARSAAEEAGKAEAAAVTAREAVEEARRHLD